MKEIREEGFMNIALVLAVFVTAVKCFNCPEGYFGSDCRGVCHCNETESQCDPRSGLCPPECNPRTERCRLACDPRTGRCPNGCADGWTGELCQTPLTETTSFPISVVGLAIGVGIMALLFSLGGTCYCLSRPSLRPADNPRARARQERLNRLHEILHHYHIPTFPRRHSNVSVPGRPLRHPQKIHTSNSLPFLPSYQEAANTSTANTSSIPPLPTTLVTSPIQATSATPPYATMGNPGVPVRPDSPPPPYTESVAQPVYSDVMSASGQDSRRSSAIVGGPMIGVWTLT